MSDGIELSVLNTEPLSSVFMPCRNNWWGSLGSYVLYDIHCYNILKFQYLKDVSLWSDMIQCRVHRSQCWNLRSTRRLSVYIRTRYPFHVEMYVVSISITLYRYSENSSMRTTHLCQIDSSWLERLVERIFLHILLCVWRLDASVRL